MLRFNKADNATLRGGGRNLFAAGAIVDDESTRHLLKLREEEGGTAVFEGGTARVFVDFWVDGKKIGPAAEDVTFTWSTQNFSARAGTQFTGVSGASATIKRGETGVALEIQTLADTDSVGARLLLRQARRRRGVSAGQGESFVRSGRSGDLRRPHPELSRRRQANRRADAGISGHARRRPPPPTSTWPGRPRRRAARPPLPGKDYTAASGTLTIKAGETRGTISVRTLQDSVDEPDEDFTVTLVGQVPGSVKLRF